MTATQTTAPLTMVTAYYQLKDTYRARTPRDYRKKMSRFLPFIKWPVVVFCEAESVDQVMRLRGDKPTVCYVTPVNEFLAARHRDILHAHNAQRQPGFNVDILLIWHEKANFVRRVMDANPYQSERFFWVDIALMRGGWAPLVSRLSARIEWPNLQAVRALGDHVTFFGRPNLAPPPRKNHPVSMLDYGRALGRQARAGAALL